MKRRFLAAFLAAALALGLLVTAAAADDAYFLSLNDTLAPLTADLMPIRVGTTVYIPCTVFDQRIAGISLGIYYGQDKTLGTVTLYSKEDTLIFNINGGYAYDSSGGYYNYKAISRNGRAYLPAFWVCDFFGMEYSNLATDYGPLLRLKSGKVWLSDAVFISSAATLMSSRLSEYRAQNAPVSVSAAPTASSYSPSGDRSDVRVYLAIQVESGAYLEEMVDTLTSLSVPALFFFKPAELLEYDDLVRRIAASGGGVGLVAQGDTTQQMLDGLQEGNRLLEGILHQRTYIVRVDGTDSQRNELNRAGYLCYLENVDGRPYGRGISRLTSDIMKEVDAKSTFARVLMNDTGSTPSALRSILNRLMEEQYDLRLAVETSF
jgi:peptidoglycan/xylan/chitin deacetylase (PgdA/CDA1 family)